MTDPHRPPLLEEASAKASVVFGESTWHATWYPSMGGYVSPCWLRVDQNGCVDVLVYHDGEFPFSEDDDRSPARIHHCDTNQFRAFADDVDAVAEASK